MCAGSTLPLAVSRAFGAGLVPKDFRPVISSIAKNSQLRALIYGHMPIF
jgi:hypothetical protein